MLAVALATSIAIGAVPATAEPQPQPPIDVPFYSQLDPTWADLPVGYNEDVRMRSMGSLLTAIAMVASSYGLEPKFRVPGGFDLLATPNYIHEYLIFGGYRPSPAKTVIIDYNGLLKAFYSTGAVPSGLHLFPHSWPAVRPSVDEGLDRGKPSILYVQPQANQFHPVVVVGWDAATASYLVLDPAWRTPRSPAPMRHLYGAGWERKVAGALLTAVKLPPGVPNPFPEIDLGSLIDVSTKSPVETMVVDPDGRRAGFDAATGSTVIDIPGATYLPQPVWADPTGELPPRAPGRLLTVPGVADGRYRFEMLATGDGPFTLSVRARDAGGELVVDESVTGTVTTGQVVKFQVQYSSTGPSGFTRGDNFEPQARTDGNRLTTVGTAVAFDAGASYDLDGTITAYQWDFGDGTTATGPTTSHVYASHGTYPVSLTVTDDRGATGSDTAMVSVFRAQATAGTTEMVSLTPGGEQALGASLHPALTPDGRLVAYESWATNVNGGRQGIVVRDRQTGTLEFLSPPFCDQSYFPEITPDGRFVVFECRGSVEDLGVRVAVLLVDRLAGTVERIDVSSTGEGGVYAGPSLDHGSIRPAITEDGRFVAFYSDATNLVPGDTNDRMDVFVRDRLSGTTERINVTPEGTQVALGAGHFGLRDIRLGISADGRSVAFVSQSNELVPGPLFGNPRVFLRDRQLAVTELVSVPAQGAVNVNTSGSSPSISADGRHVAFSSGSTDLVPGDTNQAMDVFVRDRVAGTTERVSLSDAGAQSECPPFRCDNRDPIISRDGRFVVFYSQAGNLVPNDTTSPPLYADVFVRDRVAGTTEAASVSTDGQLGNGTSGHADSSSGAASKMAVSPDGRFVAFGSLATSLGTSDSNGAADIFVRDRRPAGATPIADPSGPYLGWATSAGQPAFVSFDASRSFDPAGRPMTARWDFGDGSPVTVADVGAPVAHAYAAPGRYTVTLVVRSGGQDSASVTTTAAILPPLGPPTLTLLPACGQPGDRIAASVAGHPRVSPAGGWDLGPAPLPTVRSVHPAEQTRVSFTGPGEGLADQVVPIEGLLAADLDFSARFAFTVGAGWTPGAYMVLAPEEGGAAAEFTVPCPALPNEPPSANSGGPYTGSAGTPVSFDGRQSADPEGSPLTYTWSFEDGGTATGPQPSHAFLAPGTYWALLVVDDGQLESPTSVGTGSYTTVTISEGPTPTPGQTILDLTARPKHHAAVELQWTCPVGTVKYNVYRGTSATGPTERITTGLTSPACIVTDSGLIPGKTYYYRVTSVDAGGLESLPSNQASAKPARWQGDSEPCEVPPGHGCRR
jgi:PKD repeat protein